MRLIRLSVAVKNSQKVRGISLFFVFPDATFMKMSRTFREFFTATDNLIDTKNLIKQNLN